MIAEIIPQAYDAGGRQVSQPLHKKGLHPTFPIGRYLSRQLSVCCGDLETLRQFLCKCRATSDEELFGKREYWQPPDEFEKRKAGDCEDFSLWTWRQLLMMGYDARVVFGRHGRYGEGHSWVLFFQDGKCFLLEPQARFLGLKLPRLSTLPYKPIFSIGWNGDAVRYYAHKTDSKSRVPAELAIRLIPEWVDIWGRLWLKFAIRFPQAIAIKTWAKLAGKARA